MIKTPQHPTLAWLEEVTAHAADEVAPVTDIDQARREAHFETRESLMNDLGLSESDF